MFDVELHTKDLSGKSIWHCSWLLTHKQKLKSQVQSMKRKTFLMMKSPNIATLVLNSTKPIERINRIWGNGVKTTKM